MKIEISKENIEDYSMDVHLYVTDIEWKAGELKDIFGNFPALKGIEKCINLEILSAAENDIKYIDFITKLSNLNSIDLSNNPLESVLPLFHCKKITSLKLKN